MQNVTAFQKQTPPLDPSVSQVWQVAHWQYISLGIDRMGNGDGSLAEQLQM